MSETNINELAQSLGNLNVMELIALTKKLEGDWGVSATPQVQTVVQLPGTDDHKPAEQTEFNVSLVAFPADKKMPMVKLVREMMGLGLVDSKNFVESLPKFLKEGATKEEADQLKAKFTELGATVEVK